MTMPKIGYETPDAMLVSLSRVIRRGDADAMAGQCPMATIYRAFPAMEYDNHSSSFGYAVCRGMLTLPSWRVEARL
jgi:hypothetical protein